MGGAHPLSEDRAEPRPELVEAPPAPSGVLARPNAPSRSEPAQQPADEAAARLVRVLAPRLMVIVALIVAGIVWALIRGLHFYGLAPLHIAYDLDQPPVLLVLVGGWLAYRSSRR